MHSDSTIGFLIDDVGGAVKAARLCGVHKTTVYRWLRGASPLPQAAYRTLYHASRWGRGDRQSWSDYQRQLAGLQVATLQRRIDELEAEVARLVRLGNFGSANAPLFRLVRA